ncbi:MAG: alpha/beta hydrolase, partial [Clostridia bacterium]|nr:alpha/beta hydrolase [Clostridia bacterium]
NCAINKRSITIGDGRLYYQSYGNGEHIVILLHGLVGGSWLNEEWIYAIQMGNVRCIVPERPGYGNSSPLPFTCVGDWMPVAQRFCEALGVRTADVIGCSAGGPYAYATALALPDTINKVYVLGGVPAVYNSEVLRHYSEENQTAYKSFLENSQQAVQNYYMEQMKAARRRMEEAGAGHIKIMLDEVIAQRCFGMAQESRLQIRPWEVEFSNIKQPIVLYHAKGDEMVPFAAAQEMAALLPRCEFHEMGDADFPAGQSVHMSAISKAFCRIISEY